MAKKPKPDDPAQSRRFIETAREIGADETEEGANRAFESVRIKELGQTALRQNPKSE